MSTASHGRVFVTLWTAARQAPLSMDFSRQEYWRGLPFPAPGDLPDQGSNLHPVCPLHQQADPLLLSHQTTWGTTKRLRARLGRELLEAGITSTLPCVGTTSCRQSRLKRPLLVAESRDTRRPLPWKWLPLETVGWGSPGWAWGW